MTDLQPNNPDRRIQTVCLVVLATVVAAAAMKWLQPMLVPFLLSVFFMIALKPVAELLGRRFGLPHIPAVLLTFLLGLVLLGILGTIITLSLMQLKDNIPAYQKQLVVLLDRLAEALPLQSWGSNEGEFKSMITGSVGSMSKKFLAQVADGLGAITSSGTLVLIFLGFLLFGAPVTRRVADTDWDQIERQVKKYIIVKISVSVATGVLVGLSLWLIGIEMAMMFGLLAFLLNFIPSIGSIIAVFLPLPVVLLNPDLSVAQILAAFAIPGAIEFTIGNIIEPRMLGENLDLHPITVLMALIFWGMLWGVIGMFLATPLTALLKIFLQRHEDTRPLAELLAGRIHWKSTNGEAWAEGS
jgi:AI-2 transport protein TqsA